MTVWDSLVLALFALWLGTTVVSMVGSTPPPLSSPTAVEVGDAP